MHTTIAALGRVEAFNGRRSSVLLMLLLGGDLLFIGLYFVNIFTPILSDALFNIDTDRGYAECYQYLKFGVIAGWFVALSLKSKTRQYLAWAFIFAYLLLDDSLGVHEQLGGMIVGDAGDVGNASELGLTAKDFGELIVMGFAAVLLFAILARAYQSGTQIFKMLSRSLMPFMLALFFCGVVVDMLHVAIDLGTAGAILLGLLEDGGEMFSASVILWHVSRMSVSAESVG